MSHECCHGHGHHNHDSCCSHHHHHDESCSLGEGSCDVKGHSCSSEHEHENFAEELLQLADEAWMDVLRCKVKDKIKENSGDHLDQLAAIIAEGNHNRWKIKMSAKQNINDFKSKMRDFFNR
jgi:hypothetical protein